MALGLGGNLGEVAARFEWALNELGTGLDELRVASLFRTAPLGPPDQPPFLNTAAVAKSRLAPDHLLAWLKALELAAGRRPGRRHAPRLLDLDLLVYGDLETSGRELSLPHPRLRERRFVLEPLAEIAPHWRLPPDGSTPRELLSMVAHQEVERIPRDDADGSWRPSGS